MQRLESISLLRSATSSRTIWVRELRQAELFETVAVSRHGEANPGSGLRLTGEITDYKKGSRLMRYMVPGAGKTKLVAEYRLVEQPAETVIVAGKVDGMVVLGGLLKGASDGVASGLAKEIAKKVKSNLKGRKSLVSG